MITTSDFFGHCFIGIIKKHYRDFITFMNTVSFYRRQAYLEYIRDCLIFLGDTHRTMAYLSDVLTKPGLRACSKLSWRLKSRAVLLYNRGSRNRPRLDGTLSTNNNNLEMSNTPNPFLSSIHLLGTKWSSFPKTTRVLKRQIYSHSGTWCCWRLL